MFVFFGKYFCSCFSVFLILQKLVKRRTNDEFINSYRNKRNRRSNQGYDEFVDFVQRMITVL